MGFIELWTSTALLHAIVDKIDMLHVTSSETEGIVEC